MEDSELKEVTNERFWILRPSDQAKLIRQLGEYWGLPRSLVSVILDLASIVPVFRITCCDQIPACSNMNTPYFSTPVLEHTPGVRKLVRIECNAISKDQGWSSYPEDHGKQNSWAFHELAIAVNSEHPWWRERTPRAGHEVAPLRMHVFSNFHAVDEYRHLKRSFDVIKEAKENVNFQNLMELYRNHEQETMPDAEAEHRLVWVVRSIYPCWTNHVKVARMDLVFATKLFE